MKNRRYLDLCMPEYMADALRRHVLVDIHELLKTAMRDTDTLVRWGGEGFLLIARNSSRHEAAAIAERIRSIIAGHAFIVGKRTTSLRLTCSIGFAPFPFLPSARTPFSWQEVLDTADTCLYAAKHAGRNRTVGILAGECRDPETLIQRIRQSLHEVVASGEVTLATGGESNAIAV